jgi:hypothetical protein
MMPKNEEQLAILKDRSGGEIALKGVTAHARLNGLLAEVEVEQSYLNPQDTNIEAVYTGTIPPHHYFMSAPNPDSLDSRYALVGWVDEQSIIGRAIEIL